MVPDERTPPPPTPHHTNLLFASIHHRVNGTQIQPTPNVTIFPNALGTKNIPDNIFLPLISTHPHAPTETPPDPQTLFNQLVNVLDSSDKHIHTLINLIAKHGKPQTPKASPSPRL